MPIAATIKERHLIHKLCSHFSPVLHLTKIIYYYTQQTAFYHPVCGALTYLLHLNPGHLRLHLAAIIFPPLLRLPLH